MEKLKKYKSKITAVILILSVLVIAWFWGGVPTINMPTPDVPPDMYDAPLQALSPDAENESDAAGEPENQISAAVEPGVESQEIPTNDHAEENQTPPAEVLAPPPHEYDTISDTDMLSDTNTPTDTTPNFDIVPEVANPERFAVTPEGVILPDIAPEDIQIFAADHPEMRAPVEPEDVVIGDGSFTVTLSVRAHTILYNMHLLHRDKHELVPEDGWIFPPTEVVAFEGESVFNVLQREMRRERIHMVARWTPIFNSAYVEAINNLYEFDVGPLSGWMYRVNGWFPNFGASRYLLSDGDVIEWIYTVDLGRDLGVHWLAGGVE